MMSDRQPDYRALLKLRQISPWSRYMQLDSELVLFVAR